MGRGRERDFTSSNPRRLGSESSDVHQAYEEIETGGLAEMVHTLDSGFRPYYTKMPAPSILSTRICYPQDVVSSVVLEGVLYSRGMYIKEKCPQAG